MRQVLAVASFGVLGVLARYLLGTAITRAFPGPIPWATGTINTVGCLLIGLFAGIFLARPVPPELQIGLLVGFLGGFTTFSSFAYETFKLLQEGRVGLALGYLFLSPLLGLFAVFVGYQLALSQKA